MTGESISRPIKHPGRKLTEAEKRAVEPHFSDEQQAEFDREAEEIEDAVRSAATDCGRLVMGYPTIPEFVAGNLCDPTQVLTRDEMIAQQGALTRLSEARSGIPPLLGVG